MFSRRTLACIAAAVLASGAFQAAPWSDAVASGGSLKERTAAIMTELEADASAREMASGPLERARAALARGASTPEHTEGFEAAALQWAEAARDLRRARDAELAADALEREGSALQTELVRTRAAVEQAMARVGRARQELAELEAQAGAKRAPGKAKPSAAPPAAPASPTPPATTPPAAPQRPAQ